MEKNKNIVPLYMGEGESETLQRELEFGHTNKGGDELEDIKINHPGAFIHVENGDENNLYIGSSKVTDNYNSLAEDTWVTEKVGGMPAGVSASVLKNKSVSEILDTILYPTIIPTKPSGKPSVSISYNGNIITSIDRGKFSNNEIYAGEYTSETFDDGNGKVYIKVTFGAGLIPKDNKGNEHPELQYKGGVVTSNTLYTMYCNGVWMSNESTPFPLTASLSQKNMTSSTSVMVAYAPQADGGEPFEIYLKNRTISSIQTLSDLTGKWSDENRGVFVKNGVKEINGIIFDVWQLVNSTTGNAKIRFELR